MFNYAIYGILVLLGFIGVVLLNLSADFAIQLSQYNFESDTARVSWYKDALLSGGIGLIVTVLVIVLYNEVQNVNMRADVKRRRSIAVDKLIGIYRMALYFAIYKMQDRDDYDFQDVYSAKDFKEIFNDKYYDEMKKVNIISESLVGGLDQPKLLYVSKYFKHLAEDVEKLMVIYEAYFDAKLFELINETADSEFSTFIRIRATHYLGNAIPRTKPYCFDEDTINKLKSHIEKHIKLINQLEKIKYIQD